jgi:hypothetical protein
MEDIVRVILRNRGVRKVLVGVGTAFVSAISARIGSDVYDLIKRRTRREETTSDPSEATEDS